MDKFQYRPIEETDANGAVRLIHLHPGQNTDDIRCALTHVSLSDSPIYDTVSYAWGDATYSVPIICDGARLAIPRNLYNFLRQVRDVEKPLTLWADAICIDQSNIAERNSQVQRMRSVYSKARRVLVWLGPADDGSDEAMQLVQRLNGRDARAGNPLLSFTGAGIAPVSHPVWGYLADLFNRPYFQRVWVVQEVALSQSATVLCGSSSASWEGLIQAGSYICTTGIDRFLGRVGLYVVGNIEMARQDHLRSITRSPLNLLLRQQDCVATDARDKVFALYGMSEDAFHELGLDPDYGIETAQLYRDVAVRILKKSLNLDILGAPRSLVPHGSVGETLPSWVPDWSNTKATHSLLRLETQPDGLPFKASRESSSSPIFSFDCRRLGLEGYIVDSISAVSLTLSNTEHVNTRAHFLNMWKQLALSFRTSQMQYHSVDRVTQLRSQKTYQDQDPIDVFWITLRGGHNPEGVAKARKAFRAWDKSFHALGPLWFNKQYLLLFFLAAFGILTALAFVRHKLGIDTPLVKPEFDFINDCAIRQRRVFRTKGGFVGLGPGSVEKGDYVVLCKGGKLPLVLREHGDDYELLGDSFIYGMMNGQRWDDRKCHRIWLV
jgi:hypothetical protein